MRDQPPALILLPGLDGTGRLHGDFLSMCSRCSSTRAIAYPTHQVLDYAALTAFVREQLPKDGMPFVLLGESFSGPIALSIAANPPGNLVGLILCASFASSPFPALAGMSSLLKLAPVHSTPMTLLAPLLLGRWSTSALKDSLRAALNSVAPQVLRARAQAALKAEVGALAQITAPTLYLRASAERLMPANAAEKIRQGISQCQVIDIDGPHLLLQTRPNECAQVVNAFIRSNCLTPPASESGDQWPCPFPDPAAP